MKKNIMLLLFICPLICYGQLNDTIFYKNGKIEPVYSIDVIHNNRIYYTPKQNSEQVSVSVKLIEIITSKNKNINNESIINLTQKDVITLSTIEEIQYVFSDTVFFKTGEKYPVYKIRRINDKVITFNVDPVLMSSIDINLVEGYYSSSLIDKNRHDLEYYKANQNLPEIDYEIGWLKHNLERFHKQKRASHICMGAGIISGVVYVLNPLENTIFGYVAGGLSLASFIIDIDSYKWIKRASLETNANSVTLKVNF